MGTPPVDREMRLTHPDRVLYPEMGATKRALADYYVSVAYLILPHVVGRPLAILRCPRGREQPCFFQRHYTESTEAPVRQVSVVEADGEEATAMAIDDLPGLIALVQMGVLELHPWGCKVDDLDRPDQLVFDLDPGEGVAWPLVIEASLRVKSALADQGLVSFVKTSGGKGLHVVVPLERRAGWDQARSFAEAFADRLAREQPARYVLSRVISKRKGKIFIDVLRNVRGATSVAPYSTRARAGAPISVPLDWEELNSLPSARSVTLGNFGERLKRPKPAWMGFFETRQSIPGSLVEAVEKR